ncbi:MAG TPA: hypothetical protein VJM09_08720 [Sphingobium sp.]|nr:hypothetical protein [Sphingobium sp.]
MNEYLSQSGLTQVDRVSSRAPSGVPVVSPVSAVQAAGDPLSDGRRERGSAAMLAEEDLVSAAEYAKVHARVADILAELRSVGAASIEGAEAQIQSMLPAPMILVPLPPASKEVMESAVELGKRIAEQASYAHAAQAHLRRGTVDQLLSTAA